MGKWFRRIADGSPAWLERIKKDKKLLLLVAAGLVGMVILLVTELVPSGGGSTEQSTHDAAEAAQEQSSYVSEVEKGLEEIISAIAGAGRTKVMVTLENSEESVWATQGKNSRESGGADGAAQDSSEEEYGLIRPRGSEEGGLLLKIIQPRIRGVAIVCDGGDNVYVREKITAAVASVLDISTAKISIAKMASEQ